MAHSVAVFVIFTIKIVFMVYVHTFLIHDSNALTDIGFQSAAKYGFSIAVNILFRSALKQVISKNLSLFSQKLFSH
jgi:hypothetical protein